MPWVVVIISVKKPTATLKMHLHSMKAAKEATLQTHIEKQRERERESSSSSLQEMTDRKCRV